MALLLGGDLEDHNIISRKEAKILGLRRYFTGLPCKHGHIAQREIGNGCCIECKRVWTENWRNKPEDEKFNNIKTAKELPPSEYLNSIFNYDEITGKLYWKDREQRLDEKDRDYKTWKVKRSGKEAGYTHFANNYIEIRLPSGELHKAHRIIWKMKTGEEPNLKLDHINGIRTDNRFENLRLATDQENARNSITYSATGYKGVTFDGDKYIANYAVKDINYIKRGFDTPEDAAKWYDNNVKELYGEFAKLNFPDEVNINNVI
ncbi:hypothetical protein BNNNBJKE_00052 [Aeromonas phage vB_AdhM_DL]|nr:hypothetical protein BNNNBJKE_00052 [Aeromonas phage vB_AdhM_DL]